MILSRRPLYDFENAQGLRFAVALEEFADADGVIHRRIVRELVPGVQRNAASDRSGIAAQSRAFFKSFENR